MPSNPEADVLTYSMTAEEIAPTWYALVVTRGREAKAREMLMQDAGIDYAFFPNEVKSWTVRGKHYKRKRALVAGLVFTKFVRRPLWHVLKERELLHGVMCCGCVPAPIHPVTIKRLQRMAGDADALREAELHAKIIKVGDKARFPDGPLGDFAIEVTHVDGTVVEFVLENGLVGKTDVDNLIKAAE